MYTIRCTRQLRARIPVGEPGLETRTGATTTRLGDWYAALHTQHRRPWVLAVSERSLLPILLPLAPAYNLPMRLLFAVTDRLRALGIGDRQVDREADAMSDGFVWRPTNNRSIVGVLTQFSLDLRFMWTRDPNAAPEALANLLSESPMKPIGYDDPRRRTLTLFDAGPAETTTVH